MAKSKKGLDSRHRDKSGRIEKKHGNTRIGSLRKEDGPGFAKGRRKDMMLKNLLAESGCELPARISAQASSLRRRPPSRGAREAAIAKPPGPA